MPKGDVPKIGKKSNILEKKIAKDSKKKANLSKSKGSKPKISGTPSKGLKGTIDDKIFTSYLYKLYKKHNPDLGANKDAMVAMNAIMLKLYDELG